MDTYTKVLEFFMENGVQLTTEQMNRLESICEVTKEDIDISKLKKLINKICKDNFDGFCDYLSKNDHYKKDAEEFREGKPPVFGSLTKDDSDSLVIYLKYFSGWNDTQLFFQDYIIKKLNQDKELSKLGYHFSGEDYLGIYISVK